MNKKNLQDLTDYKVMTAKECLDKLGWKYTETEKGYEDIKCSCGKEVECSGFFSTERIECPDCNKRMADMFGVLITGNSTATMLDPNDFDISDKKYWIVANDGNAGIMEKQEDKHE